MKIQWIFTLLWVLVAVPFSTFGGAIDDRSQAISSLIQEQCEFAGGLQKGFCTCLLTAEDKGKIAESILKTVQSKKIDSKSAMIINPFVQVCPGNGTKLGYESVLRLTHLSWLVSEQLTSDGELAEEIALLQKIGLLDLEKILGYMQSQDIKKDIKAKLAAIEDSEKWTASGIKSELRAAGTSKLKSATYDKLNEMAGFDLELTQDMIAKLYPKMQQEFVNGGLQKIAKENLGTLLKKGLSHAKTLAVDSLGHAKGSLLGLARGAVIETAKLVTGYDFGFFDYLDPVRLMALTIAPTAAQAGTVDLMIADDTMGFLTKKIIDDQKPTFNDVVQGVDLLYRSGAERSMAAYSSKVMNMAAYMAKRTQGHDSNKSLIDSFWIEP